MAKQKKRGFFSWLGFGEKEQETEQKTEEQQVVEEQSQPETPVETAAVVEAEEPAHSKEEIESFAEEVVEVTEQVQESEKPEPVIVETLTEAPQALSNTKRCRCPKRLKLKRFLPKSGWPKRKPLKLLRRWKKKRSLSQS